jgi:hypothetical protein
MPHDQSTNHPTRLKESTDLYQTTNRGLPVESEEITDDDFPIGMLPGHGSEHNVNTVVQPSITVQAAIHRLKVTAMDPTHKYSNATGEDAMSWRWRFNNNDPKRIPTNIKGLDLVVAKDSVDYYAFLVKGKEPQGYVKFEGRLAVPSPWHGVVFTPHSYVREKYRGKGYITSVYQWFLKAGHGLLASDKHSPLASALWKGLLAKYPHQFLNHTPNEAYPFKKAPGDTGKNNTVALVTPNEQMLKKLLKGID